MYGQFIRYSCLKSPNKDETNPNELIKAEYYFILILNRYLNLNVFLYRLLHIYTYLQLNFFM